MIDFVEFTVRNDWKKYVFLGNINIYQSDFALEAIAEKVA